MNVKRLLCVILAMAVVFCTFPVIQVSASGYTMAQVKEKFPDGKYWNHLCKPGHYIGGWVHTGAACGDVENTVTDHPCTSNYVDVGVGGYSCNTYKNIATQCCGFAKKVANLAYGVYDCASSWSCVRDKNKVASVAKPGDVLHYTGYDSSGDGHWVVVISVSGSVVTVAECNYPGGTCQIKWGRKINIYELGDTIWLYQAPYKWEDCKHSYTSDSPYVCTKCNEWKTDSLKSTKSLSNVQFVITSNDAKDHTGPYGDCKSVNEYSKNTVVTAVQEVVNGYGHTWYKLSNGNYIFSDYVKKYSVSYVNIDTGTYYLKNAATGTYLSVSYGADNNEQPVNLWTSTGDDMKMVIENAPTGYKIRPYISASRLINPFAVSVVHGTKVNLYNNMNDSSQWWQFEKVGSYYVLHNVQNPSCVLDAPGGATSLVYTNNYTGASSQKWTLEPVNPPATYVIEVNGNIDYEKEVNTTDGYGTFDVYINDKLVADDVTDYSEAHPVGTKYEIKGVKTVEGRCYHGCISGNISGTLGAQRTKIVIVFASAHRFDDGTIITPATYATDGVIKYVCKSCSYSKTEVIPKTGYVIEVNGNIDYEKEVNTTDGYGTFDVYINDKLVADDVTDYSEAHPVGTKYEIKGAKAEEGRCYHGCISGNISGTLGAQRTKIVIVFASAHRFDDGTITIPATCTTDGVIKYVCKSCSYSKTETVPGRGNHNYNISITDATCLEGAYELKECIDCGDTVKTVLSEPSEHEFDVRIDSMPTCHTEGYRMSVCIYCEMQKHETIPMIEHRWDDGTVVKNPTASETGIIAYKCTKCTAEKEEIIPVAEFLPGDVNLDGKITAADARLCLRAAARLDELSGTPRYAADYDNDNQIKAADARLILRKAAKLD